VCTLSSVGLILTTSLVSVESCTRCDKTFVAHCDEVQNVILPRWFVWPLRLQRTHAPYAHTHARAPKDKHSAALSGAVWRGLCVCVCVCTCSKSRTYLEVLGDVCLEGLGQITVVSLQCERSARGTTRGKSRQAGARARGGARDLQVTLSGVKVDGFRCYDARCCEPCAHPQQEVEPIPLRLRGLTGAERLRLYLRRTRPCSSATVASQLRQCVALCVFVRVYAGMRACIYACYACMYAYV
jgi:hypothetical protein